MAGDPPSQGKNDLLLLAVLRQPAQVTAFAAHQWDLLIRQARKHSLLARLGFVLDACDQLPAVPHEPLQHLVAALRLAEKHKRDVMWEVRCLCKVLEPIDTPVVLLKGAAYAVADLPPARGRVFGDIDIMVRKVRIEGVENALRSAGWIYTETDPYNQHYYRTWMHQLPPMVHFSRGMTVDVHHTIVPQTARMAVGGSVLFDAMQPIAGYDNLYVLAPADMVLHNAVHLFNEGEFNNGLRDLIDLDELLRHFGKDARFFDKLVDRAEQLGLTRPLAYACRHAHSLLATPIPSIIMARLNDKLSGPVASIVSASMRRALLSGGQSSGALHDAAAGALLYIRGHAMRMPMRLLIPHLLRKAWKSE